MATHPSDFAVALVALDAMVEVHGPNGTRRTLPIGELHRLPGDTPHRETNLAPGEMIGAIVVPASAAAKRSHYLKVRDRSSFEFALVSAAVAMELEDNTIRDIRVAAGGVGTKPWRLPEVEAALSGKALSPDALSDAAGLAGQGAQPASQNAFKLTLLRRTVLRALQTVSA
ncbi:MAG TPA: FAD binding domain-containing protein [Steroidobacteraceae bacterium]|nr:FAD binding domain-containing protein [Steroidobacteraceae bacterium]